MCRTGEGPSGAIRPIVHRTGRLPSLAMVEHRVRFLQPSPGLVLDLLSSLVADLRLEVQAPRTHLLVSQSALVVPTGSPSLHLVRRGSCRASSPESRHPLPLGTGWALLLSGTRECTIQPYGPERTQRARFDWSGGTPLEEVLHFPEDPSTVLLLSARIRLRGRTGVPVPLPAVCTLRPEQVWSGAWRESLLESLNAELIHPRLGVSAIVVHLLEVFLIQGLRSELRTGVWRPPGWLGALTDPVLRTGLMDSEDGSALASVGALSAEVHRSTRTVSERVRGFSGSPPGRLLRQLRMERALRQLEQGEPTLEGLAREVGYATASTFCRAFRREVGCTPAEYWRRARNRPFPRRARHQPPRAASDGNAPALDSSTKDE